MAKIANIKPRQIVKVLQSSGFEVRRQTGSHLILKNFKTGKMTTVPIHHRALKKGLVQVIIRQSGLPKKEFLKKLGRK